MHQTEFHWTTKDNLNIYAKEWAIEKPKAVLCILHGLGEHCNRYNHVADFYNQRGYAVIGYDRRGHGQSGGTKGATPNFDAFLDEAEALLNQANQRYPSLPKIIWGHSMGGNIALNYVIRRRPSIKAMVVTGPWMKLVEEPSKILIGIGNIMNKLIGGFTQGNGLDARKVSRDKAVVDKYMADPLVHDRISSIAGLETYYAGQDLLHYQGDMPVPTLLMHGEQDKIIDVAGSRQFGKNVGNTVYKEWAGLYHEIHNEPEQKEVLEFALHWMEDLLED